MKEEIEFDDDLPEIDPEMERELEEYSGTAALRNMSVQAMVLMLEAIVVVAVALVLSSRHLETPVTPESPAGVSESVRGDDAPMAALPPPVAELIADALALPGQMAIYGTGRQLSVGDSTNSLALLRFRVEGLAARGVKRAVLNLNNVPDINKGVSFKVSLCEGSWGEQDVPAISLPKETRMLGAHAGGAVPNAETVQIELDSSVFAADGNFNLMVKPLGSGNVYTFFSREAGKPAELRLLLEDDTISIPKGAQPNAQTGER